MAIRMIGIDHSRAEIDIRTIFSFTKTKCAEALEIIKEKEGICGCVMISTCNRMELWVSCEEDYAGALVDLLCEIRELPAEPYREYFIARKEQEAVEHLFQLASGLKSRILGEDQIITQVGEALALAREHYAADHVLETLFRMAVTAGKRVKTEVVLAHSNQSAIHQALAELKARGFSPAGKTCMVIGNGAMGKLTATLLRQEGADVTVTVRQYRSGMVDIPLGCKRIDYGERMRLFSQCDLVVSATASPNYTLKEHCVREAQLTHPVILVDLAVPRDIEPSAGELPYVTRYDIDDFQVEARSEEQKRAISQAEEILAEQIEEFQVWYECRDMVPRIGQLKEAAAVDMELRLTKVLRGLPLDEEQKNTLRRNIEKAAANTVNKMLFGLRDTVSQRTFRECVEGLEKIYEK